MIFVAEQGWVIKGNPNGAQEMLNFVDDITTHEEIFRINHSSSVGIRSASIIFLRLDSQQTQKIILCGSRFWHMF